MEINNFTKILGVFLIGWAVSGFGLAHMLDAVQPTQKAQDNRSSGVPLTLTISLLDASENTAIQSGFRVELSQCSQQRPFGGNAFSCQAVKDDARNSTGNNALQQSQYTNSEGMVTFSANFPDKTAAPTTHFHVSVYDRFNNLITSSQFDFPTAVYPSMNAYFMAGGENPTTLLMEDPTANPPLVVTGNLTAGFRASRTLFVPSNADGIIGLNANRDNQVGDLKVYPNPTINTTTFAFHLQQTSEVAITVTDGTGTQVKELYSNNLTSGSHEIEIDLGGLQKGVYFYRLEVSNKNGTFSEAKKLIKA